MSKFEFVNDIKKQQIKVN